MCACVREYKCVYVIVGLAIRFENWILTLLSFYSVTVSQCSPGRQMRVDIPVPPTPQGYREEGVSANLGNISAWGTCSILRACTME